MPPTRSLTNLPHPGDSTGKISEDNLVRQGYPQSNHRQQDPDWYQQQNLNHHHLQQRQLPEEEGNDGLSLNSHKDALPPSYYLPNSTNMDEKSTPPLASMPMPSGYPPRPPVGHQDSGTYSSPGNMTPNMPALPQSYEAAESGSGTSTPAIPGHKLRPPSSTAWMKKEAEGYQELRGQQGPGGNPQYRPPMNKRHTTSYSMSPEGSHVVLDESTQKTRLGRVYAYLMTASVITRWIIFIVPVLALLWIPGILALTEKRDAKVWQVGLLWWSIWLSVLWVGWWGALAFSRVIPYIIRATIGVVAVSTRRYIDWMQALHRYVAFFAWSVAIFTTFQPLIKNRNQPEHKSIKTINSLLLAGLICSAVLLAEKFAIQFIAGKFHERSYAERIADQKFAVKTLVNLYKYSIDVPGRSDTLGHGPGESSRSFAVQHRRLFRKLRQGVRLATTTTATVFGNVASEIAGSSVLQPNSPQAIIKTALESANKSRLLARRLFYSFAKENAEFLELEDIGRYFQNQQDAIAAFTLFDKDGNGDASREEVELACLEFHREQLSIENSMRDLDSAVGRLDNIFMSLYFIIAAIIIAICLDASFTSVLTGAGTLVLGLSWLIGGSLQEVLTSIIFLFIKHPFDVGDRVVISKETYTVKEIRLLSTIFLDGNSTLVQAPNNQLNTLFIQNIRRSPQMSETFTFDVNYSTTFEDLEKLRVKMLEFIHNEKRDFQPAFDVTVKDFPEQTKMTLSADIKYKSNSQQGALKAKRRNKWICALKATLAELKIFGPDGDPNAAPGVKRVTTVPWDIIEREDRAAKAKAAHDHDEDMHRPTDGWKLGDKNAGILDPADDVFGDASALHLTNPRRGLSDDNIGTQGVTQRVGFGAPAAPPHAAEVFELRQRP